MKTQTHWIKSNNNSIIKYNIYCYTNHKYFKRLKYYFYTQLASLIDVYMQYVVYIAVFGRNKFLFKKRFFFLNNQELNQILL